jgi:hypothetical protein
LKVLGLLYLTFYLVFVNQAGVTGAAMSGVVASEGGRRNQSSIPVLHSGSHFRHGLLQLMIHTIDPLNDGEQFNKNNFFIILIFFLLQT